MKNPVDKTNYSKAEQDFNTARYEAAWAAYFAVYAVTNSTKDAFAAHNAAYKNFSA